MDRTRKLVVTLSFASFLWCVAVGVLLWFLPSGGQSFASISALGPVPLIIPVALVAVGAWSAYRRHRLVLVVATGAIALFAFLTGFSIGLAYLPAAAALVVASIADFSASGRRAR
jgi:hypothetical protein